MGKETTKPNLNFSVHISEPRIYYAGELVATFEDHLNLNERIELCAEVLNYTKEGIDTISVLQTVHDEDISGDDLSNAIELFKFLKRTQLFARINNIIEQLENFDIATLDTIDESKIPISQNLINSIYSDLTSKFDSLKDEIGEHVELIKLVPDVSLKTNKPVSVESSKSKKSKPEKQSV